MSAASDMREKRYEMNAGSRERGGSRANRTPGVADGLPAGVEIISSPPADYEEDGRTYVYIGYLDVDSARVRPVDRSLIDRYYDEMTRGANDEMDPLKREDLIKANALKFPLLKVVFETETGLRYLPDGNHTAAAARRAGLDYFHAEVTRGTLRDALLIAFSANNQHGVTNSDEVRKANALKMLADAEWSQWSDREIARRCGVSPTSVGSWRKQLAAQREQPQQQPLPPAERRIERNGVVTWMKTDGINANRPGANARVAPIVEAAPLVDSAGAKLELGMRVELPNELTGTVISFSGSTVGVRVVPGGLLRFFPAESLRVVSRFSTSAAAAPVSARLSEQTDTPDKPDSAPKHVESIIRDKNSVQITLDAQVKTRSGRTGAVVGMSGRAITVREDGVVGTRMHYAETLEVVAGPVEVKATPQPPAPGLVLAEEVDGVAETMLRIENTRITEIPAPPDAGSNPLNGKTLSVRTEGMDMTTFQALAVAMRRGTRITLLVCIHEDEEEAR